MKDENEKVVVEPVAEVTEQQKLMQKHARKILNKNAREIKRLKGLVELALLENNYPRYEYALCKLRDIYRQPYSIALIKAQFATSRQALFDVIAQARKLGK